MPPKVTSRDSWLVRYGVALAAVGGAVLFRWGLTELVGEGLPTYITFYPALMAAALFGGFGPGLVATAAAALVVDYWVLAPAGQWGIERPVDAVGLAFFGGVGLFMSVVVELYHRAEAELRQHRDHLQEMVAARAAEAGQANESLRQQREWLQVTLNSIGDAVLATDTAGRITFLNPIAQALTGWKEAEALGQPVQQVFRTISEDTREPGDDILAHVLLEGGVVALTNHTTLVARDGREVPIEDSAAPIRDSAGTVSGMVVVFHDVTERRRAQSAMRESQRQNEFLANVIAGASQPFGVGYLDGRLGLLNRAFEELTGYTAAELRTMDWTKTLTPPEWRELERQKLEELQRTGQPVRYQKEYLRKDGRRVPIELLVHLARDAGGKPEYFYSFLTDITERKQADEKLRQHTAELQATNRSLEESRQAAVNLMEDALLARKAAEAVSVALQESQERLAAFAAATFEGIVLTDEGRIVDCNEQAAQMVGRTRQEVIGTTIAEYLQPEDLESAMQRIQAGQETVTEHQLVRRDGSRITVEAHGRPTHLPGSSLRHTAMRDITRRKQREQLLERLNLMLKALRDSSQAMMRAASEAEYLAEVCRIVVEDCGHALVWVGLAEDDEARTVRPVASAGFEEGYLETLNLTWADTERGRGPTGAAIRTGQPCSCANMLTDPAFTPWRAEALKRGYASSLAVPLLAGGRAFGAITIYSKQPHSISADEQGLLTQLADDVSYCIRTLRLREAKIAADVERDKFVSLADNSTEFIGMCDMNFIPFYVNGAGLRLVGLDSLAQACRTPVSEFFFPEDRKFIQEDFIPRVLREGRAEVEVRFRHFKTGAPLWMIYTVFHVKDAEGRPVGLATVSRNITERRRAEQRASLLAGTASQLLTSESPRRVVEDLCDRVLTFLDCHVFFNYLVEEPSDRSDASDKSDTGDKPTPRLRLNACGGIPAEVAPRIGWLEYGGAVCGCAARDGCRIVVENIQETPDPRTKLVKALGMQAYACHPLMVEGRLLGTLSFGTRTRTRFTEDDLSLMKAVVDLVAIAMERQRAQAALRKINEELEHRVAERTAELHAASRYARSLLEASLDPLVTISMAGTITDVNEATELATGVSRARLIGSDFSSYFTEPAKAKAGYEQVLAEGLVRDYPLTIRHATGRLTDVLYNATVYCDEAGEVQGVFAAARDITERRLAERRRDLTTALLALFAQKNSARDYLHSVVAAVRQWTGCQALGIRIADEQGEIPYASWAGFETEFIELENGLKVQRDNCCCIRAITRAYEAPDRAALTPGGSYRLDDAVAFVNALPPEHRARYLGNCMSFGFASLAVIPIGYREAAVGVLHLADRRPGQFPLAMVEFLETLTPLIGEAVHRFQTEAELSRHRDHLEVLVRQRTQELTDANARLQQSAEDLQRSNRDLEQFAYVASHDLQEPLRAVGGYVKLLEHRVAGLLDDRARHYIDGAFEGAVRMERLIRDLLAFSRVGTRGETFVRTDLNAVLRRALDNLAARITASEAAVTHDSLPTLQVDGTQFMQVFQNLISNALKFHGAAPPIIHVCAHHHEGRWVCSVRDNGIGIEPEYFERIFQLFQRLHTRKQYEGTGIGLAICKRIIERHGGTIWVKSRPGEGSTFFFAIPDAAHDGQPGAG